MSLLELKGLTVKYGEKTVLDTLNLTVEPGQWLMIVGPNGAGKTTLLNAVTQGVPYTGAALFAGRELRQTPPRERARAIAVLAQSHAVGYAFTVEEVVRLGRYAYAPGLFAARGDGDEAAVEQALAHTGLTALRSRSVLTLSGGELQRAFLAQALAQQPRLLLLDEPTSHLDLPYQKQIFELISRWLQQPGRAVCSVLHELSLAKAYGTHALLLSQGRCAAAGPVGEALSAQNLNAVYGMDVPDWMRGLLAQWQ